MTFQVTCDTSILKQFWLEERDNMPRHFRDSSDSWRVTWDEFKDFCDNRRVYHIGDALIYIEPQGDVGQIHFSILRGSEIPDFTALRDELLTEFQVLYGWISPRNRGLRRTVQGLGFHYDGFKLWQHYSYGRVLEWHCWLVTRKDVAERAVSC